MIPIGKICLIFLVWTVGLCLFFNDSTHILGTYICGFCAGILVAASIWTDTTNETERPASPQKEGK